MDNKMCVTQDQHNRIQGGTLIIQGKRYPIYKGVNIIGRNKSATVNIKNLNVSQNHAIIIIVEEGQHYISDLNSSNGTHLLGNKISPLKLYEILHEAEVKFGYVVGVYSKMPNTNSTIHLESAAAEQSQNITQSFYSVHTQLLDDTSLNQTAPFRRPQNIESQHSNDQTQDIHEAATQVMHYTQMFDRNRISSATKALTVDIHNAPTQVIALSPKPSTSTAEVENIHEMATQLITFPQRLNIPREENIHETVTQVVMPLNNVRQDNRNSSLDATVSSRVDEKENISFNLDSIIEESVIEESVLEIVVPCLHKAEEIKQMKEGENSNESVDFLTVDRPPEETTQNQETDGRSLTPLLTQDVEVPTKRLVRKLSSSQSTIESQKNKEMHSSDSETDIDDAGVIKLRQKSLRKLSSSQSDTETKTTTDDLIQNKNKEATVNSDSETDIEDNVGINSPVPQNKENVNKKPEYLESNKELETKNEHSVEENNVKTIGETNSDSETDIEDDKDIPTFQIDINKKKPTNKRLENISLQDPKTDESNSESSSQIVLTRRSNKARIIDSDSETDVEDDKIEDTSLPEITKPKMSSKKLDIDSGSETEIEDKEYEVKAQNDNSSPTEILDETDYIPATQDAFATMFQYKSAKVSNSKRNSDNVSSEESFKLGLTEMMVDENDLSDRGDQTKKNITDKLRIDKPTEESKENNEKEGVNLKTTQKIDEKSSSNQNPSKTSTSNMLGNEKVSDFYILPTQKIDQRNKSEDMATQLLTQGDEEVYMMATQKIGEKVSSQNKKTLNVPGSASNQEGRSKSPTKEDFYIMPTQKIDQKPESTSTQLINNVDEEVYMMATQKIDEKSSSKNKAASHVPVNEMRKINPATLLNKEKDADDIYIMPTQKIDQRNKPENILSVASQPNDEEVCQYMMATQKINDTREINEKENLDKEAEEDLYLMPTQAITEEKVQSNQEKDVDDNLYLMPTQKINEDHSNFKAPQKFTFKKKSANLDGSLTTILGSKPQVDPYSVDTQKVDDICKINAQSTTNDNSIDDVFLQPTQELPDPYAAETQKLDREKNKDKAKIYVTKTQNELYMTTNRDTIVPSTSHGISKQNEDLYELPTQPLLHTITEKPPPDSERSNKVTEDLSKSSLKRAGDTPTAAVPKTKRVKKSDIDALKKTIESKKTGEKSTGKSSDNDRPETLSQIEAFVKQPFKAPVNETGIVENLKIKNLQESETLSQIEAFIKKPIAAAPKQIEDHSLSNINEEERAETLSQIQRFIKKPLPPKQKQAANSKADSASTSKVDNQPKQKAPNRTSTRKTRGRQSEKVKDDEVEETANAAIKITITKDSDEDNATTADRDIDQSFALLEAKKTKARRSQRVTEVEKVKLAFTKNRRSMATASITELADKDNIKEARSTRKSKIMEPAIGTETKEKAESYDSDFSEPEVPPKVMKMSATKRATAKASVKKSVSENKNVDNKENEKKSEEVPQFSKMNTRTTIPVATEKSESSSSNIPPPSTPTRRGANKKPVEVISTPSTSKARASTRVVKNRSDRSTDTSDAESVSSNDIVLSTPSRRGRNTAFHDSPLNVTERSKRKLRPKVVFTMLDSPKLESLIRQLGGSIVDTVDSCTVLVTEHVKRSQKLLAAIGQGKPICSPEWIQASKKANEFLDPWDHILVDKEAESKWEFSLKESIKKASNEKLLTNYTFQLMVSNATDVLKGSIEACGGKCAKTSPKNVEGYLVVVASPENRNKYLKIKKQNPEAIVVAPEAIFDGVLRQELRLGRHLLT